MDHKARRLVDDEKVLVLVDDWQWNFLRFVMSWLWRGYREREPLVALYLRRRVANRLAATGQRTRLGQYLQPLPRKGRDRRSQCAIQPPTSMAGVQRYFDVCIPPGH